jgi:dUTP pyrophosphatase
MVLLVNLGHEPFEIVHGERIAQLVLAPVSEGSFKEVPQFEGATDRGTGGFGSTGR